LFNENKNYFLKIKNICAAFFVAVIPLFAQTILGSGTYRNPYSDLYSGSPLTEFHADILDKNKPVMMRDTLDVDFASRKVTFSRIDKMTQTPIWQFHYAEIEDYFRDMENHVKYSLWNEICREKGKYTRPDNNTQKSALTFAVPAHLPRWATRILGQEPPKLAITGSQKLEVGVERTVTGTKQNPVKGAPTPIFNPISDFSVKGSVGRLLSLEINLRGNVKDEDFFSQAKDQLSQIKIHYREDIPGELEDDIIQEVEIGKTNFQMPGQGLAGYSSGSNENLFGVKVRSKLGPLDLTTIASIENVETQRKTIDLSKARADSITELEYAKNQFYYIDEKYRQKAFGQTIDVPNLGLNTGKIHVFRKVLRDDQNKDIVDAFYAGGGDSPQMFERLKIEDDYIIDRSPGRQGVIQFKNRLNDDDVIGILSEVDGMKKGNPQTVRRPVVVPGRDTTWRLVYSDLWILKNGPTAKDTNSNLMLRNVYYVGTSDASDFAIKINRVQTDGSKSERNGAGKLFTDILALGEGSTIYKENPEIFDLENGYMYVPTFQTPQGSTLNPNWVFTNPELGDANTNPEAYQDTNPTVQSLYRIETSSKKRSERFNLDFGVVEGSERLWIGADTLVRNTDYAIDYGFGGVTLLSDKARAANVIECSYQKESFFMLEKKVFIGINGKLNLPGVGRNSYLSTTTMWQLMDTKKMMPKVGTEPYNRFLFDANMHLDFAPLWMTSAVNLLPFMEREAQSSASFDIETAYSSVKNSAKSNGEASIDNFNTSARIFSLGVSQASWYKAAPDKKMADSAYFYPPAWHWYWYTPAPGDNRTFRKEIYPIDRTSYGTQSRDEKQSTLKFVVQAYPEHNALRDAIKDDKDLPIVKPYAGISYGLSGATMDRTEDRYFEFWIRARKPNEQWNASGTLTIDFGRISEKISIDGKSPDESVGEVIENRTGTVSSSNDLGLDIQNDESEKYYYPNFRDPKNYGWTEMGYGDERLGEWKFDPSRDNYKIYDKDNMSNRKYANGLQGNDKSDRMDIDGNGIVISAGEGGNYFRYTINLREIANSPFHDKTTIANEPNSGWMHIRIPIVLVPDSVSNDSRIYGEVSEPSWREIRHVRFLWTGMDPQCNPAGRLDSLEFEGIQFVGNMWKEFVDTTSDISAGLVLTSVLDSRNTPNYFPPRMKRLDSLNGEQSSDYTLRLEYSGTPSNSTVLVAREFFESQSMNLSNYRAIKFWAHDISDMKNKISQADNNWFVLRFGSSNNSYYEYKTRRLDKAVGWDGEGFSIDLDTLTKLKLAWFNKHGERNPFIDTAIVNKYGDSLRIYSASRVAPTLSKISWIAFGVQNNSSQPYFGDVRINGFRATGISDYDGWALRSSMRLNWADFMENSVDFKYTDADFRSMSDDVYKESNADMSSGISSKMQLDKFLPDRLGVNIPLGGNVTTSLKRPQMRPYSDIELNNSRGVSDGISDMAGDFARIMTGADERGEVTESEKYQTRELSKSAYTGYRKSKTSQKVVPRLTADRIGIDYSVSARDYFAREGEIPESEMGKVSREGFEKYHGSMNTNQQHRVKLDYNFSPSKKVQEKLSWSPLKDSKSTSLPRNYKKMSFNLLPERTTFDLFNANYDKSEDYRSIDDVLDTTGQYALNKTPVERVGMTHGFNMTYKPISPFLTINYNLGVNRDFDRFLRIWDQNGVFNFVNSAVMRFDEQFGKYSVLFGENRRNQNVSLSFTPEITRWLTFSSDASAAYSQNMKIIRDTTFMETNIGSNFSFNQTFNIRRMFEEFSKSAKKNEKFSKSLLNISKGMETVGFENINFGYRTSMTLTNSYLDNDYLSSSLGGKKNYLLYSFGLLNRSFGDFVTGNMNDAAAFGGVRNRNGYYGDGIQLNAGDTRNTTQNISASTSLMLQKPIDLSINNISFGWTRNYTVRPDTNLIDTTTIFPDIKIGMSSSALEQLEFIKQNLQTFRLDWGYSYRRENNRTGIPSSRIDVKNTIGWGFSPLIRTTLRLKKLGLDLSYSLDLDFDSTSTRRLIFVPDEGRWRDSTIRETQKQTFTNNWTAGYSIAGKPGRTIKIFRDQIIEIVGDMEFALSINYTHPKYRFHPKIEDDDEYDESFVVVVPQMTYRVTRNIDALVYYQLIRNTTGKEKRILDKDKFALEITIRF